MIMEILSQTLEGLRNLVLLDFGKALRELPVYAEDCTDHPAVFELLGLPWPSDNLKAEINAIAPPFGNGEENRFAHFTTPFCSIFDVFMSSRQRVVLLYLL